MKHSIQWHEECLTTMRANYERERRRYEEEGKRLMRFEADCLRLEQQIAEAKRMGKDGFDQEKFMQRRASHGDNGSPE